MADSRTPLESLLVGHLRGEEVIAEVVNGEARLFNRVGRLRIGARCPAFRVEWTVGRVGGASFARRALDRLLQRSDPPYDVVVLRSESSSEVLLDPLLAHVERHGLFDFALAANDRAHPQRKVLEADRVAHEADVASYEFDDARGAWRVEFHRFESDAELH